MRIPCPFCGPRDVSEFAYRGDATPQRPYADGAQAASEGMVFDYVYLRDNPAGPISEHWYHAQGCRSWLVVERDTRTHAIAGAVLAKGASQ